MTPTSCRLPTINYQLPTTDYQLPMLHPIPIPALVITGTDTGVGKTVIAGAIGQWLRRDGRRVAVAKPCATGCVHRREGLVSEDAEFLCIAPIRRIRWI